MKAANSKFCQCLYFSSNALARKIEKLANESWKKVGLSPSHAYLLMLAIEEPGIQPTELVKQLLLTPSTITRLIEKLEEKVSSPNNRGQADKCISKSKSKNNVARVKRLPESFLPNYAAILGKEESARMVNSINKLIDKLPA